MTITAQALVTDEGAVTKAEPQASVVDLFCGAGGLSHGFLQRGFEIAAGVDIDEECRYPFESNNNAPFLRRDIGSLTANELGALFYPDQPRVLIGCAPCQPFSTYNQKNSDPKWELLDRFGDLAVDLEPEVLSMENVPRLREFGGGHLFDRFVRKLEKAGYHVAYDVLYCPDFGLAQTRSRLVLLASRLGSISLPEPTHADRYRTVRDEIDGLPALEHGSQDETDPLHKASRLSALNLRRIQSSKPGGTWRDWDAELVADCHKIPTGKGYASVYGRMSWERASPTITTQFFGFGNGRFGHPDQDRAISLREGAMLQGFPRDYRFIRPGAKVYQKTVGRLIGNAVPVRLANAIASSVADHLSEVQ